MSDFDLSRLFLELPDPLDAFDDDGFPPPPPRPRVSLRSRLDALGNPSNDLWTLIVQLAELGVIVENTNHLGDEELFAFLQQQIDVVPWVSWGPWLTTIDAVGGDSDLWLTYYASDEIREWWTIYEDDPPPPRLVPPYDRDRFLPKVEDL